MTLRDADESPVARIAAVPVNEAAATAPAAVVAPAGLRGSMAALLASHILHDGELVLLILRPSPLFVVLSSLRFIAGVLIVAIAGHMWGPGDDRSYADIAAVVIAGRLMFGGLAWMGRLYVLTDRRILRLSGVMAVNVFDCPLRKVARVRLTRTVRERVTGLASIEITTELPDAPASAWSTIARPAEVLEIVERAIARAKQNGCATRF